MIFCSRRQIFSLTSYISVTLSLFAVGGLSLFRCGLLIVAQLLGGIAAAALVAALTPFGGAESLKTELGTGVNVTQGLFIEVGFTLEHEPMNAYSHHYST